VAGAEGDWRRYRTLFSTGDGAIFGVDAGGRVLGWRRWGYFDGPHDWSGPDVFGQGFTGRQVLAGTSDSPRSGFFGTDPARPRSVTYWSADGHVAGREPVGGPVPATPGWAGGVGGYGR